MKKIKLVKLKNKSVIKINTLIILKKIPCYLIITIIICFPKQCLAQITTFLSGTIICLIFSWTSSLGEPSSNLLSYQSEYEISLGDTETVRVPGKTYVDKAYGQLFIDWINNCEDSWVSNQRMMTRFINSYEGRYSK